MKMIERPERPKPVTFDELLLEGSAKEAIRKQEARKRAIRAWDLAFRGEEEE